MANKRSDYTKARDDTITVEFYGMLKNGVSNMDAYYALADEWDLSVNHIRKIIAKSANHG